MQNSDRDYLRAKLKELVSIAVQNALVDLENKLNVHEVHRRLPIYDPELATINVTPLMDNDFNNIFDELVEYEVATLMGEY